MRSEAEKDKEAARGQTLPAGTDRDRPHPTRTSCSTADQSTNSKHQSGREERGRISHSEMVSELLTVPKNWQA